MPGEHCQDHSGFCERFSTLTAELASLSAHLLSHERNGESGHVQRHEVRNLTEDVRTLTTDVQQLHEAIQKDRTDHAIQNARRDSTTKLLVALVGAAGIIAQYAFTHLLK